MKNIITIFTSYHFVEFYKKIGFMVGVATIAFIVANINLFNLPTGIVGVVSAILMQLENYWSSQEKTVSTASQN